MSTNERLARIFEEMAALLELTGANPFRINAHARVARVLLELTVDVAELARVPAKLTDLEGIGKGSAKKIIEFVRTGGVHEHHDLLEMVPPGLIDVLTIPGLGPKTVRLLWEKGGVTDLSSLRARLDSGELEKLPRLGTKSIENIKASMAFVARSAERVTLGAALPTALDITERLRSVGGASRVEYAGSLRRGRETIGDIDILAAGSDPAALSRAFESTEGVARVLVAGKTKSSVRLRTGIQVDLRVVDEGAFGAALLYFTGSKQHNVAMRERAIRRSLRLNEYGLFPHGPGQDEAPHTRGVEPVAAATEESVFAALGLPWIPPELREDRGELDAVLPDLIELSDVTSELHAHTLASDGRFTIEGLAEEARARGFHTVAVTDHSKSSVQANGLSPERLREHIEAVRAADRATEGITILAGAEVDILTDGRLDYDDDLLAELDLVIASPHASLGQDPQTASRRLVAAIGHPLVHILGHPTGRMINRREGLRPDLRALIEAALEHDTALEINANYLRLDLRDTHVRAAVEAGALLSINTDAHRPEHFDYLQYGILTARRGWLTAEQCINTWSKQKLQGWLRKKRD